MYYTSSYYFPNGVSRWPDRSRCNFDSTWTFKNPNLNDHSYLGKHMNMLIKIGYCKDSLQIVHIFWPKYGQKIAKVRKRSEV